MHPLQGALTSRTVYRSLLQHWPLIQLPVPPSPAAAGRRSLSTLVTIKSWGRVPVAMSTAANVPADGSSPSSPAGPSVTGNLKTRDDWEDDARENARREKRWNRVSYYWSPPVPGPLLLLLFDITFELGPIPSTGMQSCDACAYSMKMPISLLKQML